jgi:serine/threonine protein kinase
MTRLLTFLAIILLITPVWTGLPTASFNLPISRFPNLPISQKPTPPPTPAPSKPKPRDDDNPPPPTATPIPPTLTFTPRPLPTSTPTHTPTPTNTPVSEATPTHTPTPTSTPKPTRTPTPTPSATFTQVPFSLSNIELSDIELPDVDLADWPPWLAPGFTGAILIVAVGIVITHRIRSRPRRVRRLSPGSSRRQRRQPRPTPASGLPQTIGRHEIQELLGAGGAATIYRAHDPLLQRTVVIKSLHPHLLNTDVARRMRREGRALARLQHPAIPGIIEIIQEPGTLALVEEAVAGQPLDRVVGERGPLPLAEALSVVRAIADALDHAHQTGIVHHDVKPGNILITEDHRAYLLDFGLAAYYDESVSLQALTQQGDLLGTPAYMSPEQAQGERGDARSDVYSLGIVLYEMLTGQRPFDSGTPHGTLIMQIHEGIPERPLETLGRPIQAVVRKATTKAPNRRYQSAGELAEALEKAVSAAVATDALMADTPRARAIAAVHQALEQGKHVIIAGHSRTGKSHVLEQAAEFQENALILLSGSKKAALMDLARQLWVKGQPLSEDFAYFSDFEDVQKRLARLTVPELADIVTDTLSAGESYILIVDRLEAATEKTVREIILPLSESATVLASCTTPLAPAQTRRVQLLADRSKQIELPPLTDSEVRNLVWSILDKDHYRNAAAIENKIIHLAAGRPGAVVDLAQQLAGGGSLQEVRELSHSAGEEERVNLLTPLLIVAITVTMGARYLSRGFDDPAFYLIASLGYVLVIVLRPLLRRRKT